MGAIESITESLMRPTLTTPASGKSALTAFVLAALSLAAFPAVSHAQTVVNTGGSSPFFFLPSNPGSVAIGSSYASNTNINALFENQNYLLGSGGLNVDITATGSYNTPGSLTPGNIAAGTYVNSLYLFTDTASNPPPGIYSGTITFHSQILGLIVTNPRFNASDGTVGLAPGVTYGTARGLEFNQDSVAISADRLTLTFNARTGGNIDGIRVITAVTPEASAVANLAGALLAPGLIGMLAVRRRRRQSPSAA